MPSKLRKDDVVTVISGDDRKKVGRILKIIPGKDRAIVEGVNIVKRHTKPSVKNQQGGIMEKEAPIHISNLMLKCPKERDDKVMRTRLGVRVLADGSRELYSKKSNDTVRVIKKAKEAR